MLGMPVVQLVVQGGIGGQVLVGVDNAFHGNLPVVVIDGGLGAGGAGVQNQETVGHIGSPYSKNNKTDYELDWAIAAAMAMESYFSSGAALRELTVMGTQAPSTTPAIFPPAMP